MMAKIKIEDLTKGLEINREELTRIFGGTYFFISPYPLFGSRSGLSPIQKQFESHMEELRNAKEMVTSRYERGDTGISLKPLSTKRNS
jgi:hypothetical protein